MTAFSKKSRSRKLGGLFVFGLLWTIMSLFFILMQFSLLSVIFLLAGIGVLIYVALSSYTRFRVGEPEISISTQTLHVGEPFTVSYYHQFKNAIKLDSIRVELIFRETATYTRGTDTKTVSHNHMIAEFEEPGGQFQAGHIIQRNYNLQIPPDGMHTLKVHRNELEWIVNFVMKVPRLPNFTEEFELNVIPVLMEGN